MAIIFWTMGYFNRYSRHIRFLAIFHILLLFFFLDIHGQETKTSTDTSAVQPAFPEDSLGRRTPRGAVQGFIRAVAQQNYGKASYYLDVPKSLRKKISGEDLAMALQQTLDSRGNIFPYSLINNDYNGDLKDELANDLDRVGNARNEEGSFEVLMQKTEDKHAAPIWLFAQQTLEKVPLPIADSVQHETFIQQTFPEAMENTRWGGVPISHWLAIFVLILLSLAIAWTILKIIISLIPLVWRKAASSPTISVIKAFSLPVQLYLSVLFFVMLSERAGISIVVRQRFGDMVVVVGTIALFLLLWQLADATAKIVEKQMVRRKNPSGISATLFLRRATKIAIVIVGMIMVLNTFGLDVTTGLAALGIGGLALALGAQKTVENFVGSVTLIVDQPIRVGDFCKVGEIVGTVERIGMRSTNIRTLNRTIVTIPNGEFSSLQIENFAHRERFWFHPFFHLPYETTTDQIRFLLVELRAVLYAHPLVNPLPARVRLVELTRDAYVLEIFAYINAVDFDQFLEVQEDLYLRMLDVIATSGTQLARPAQTVHVAEENKFSPEKAAEVKEQVQQWQESGELQLPNFDADRINELKNTIPFPPEGSVSRKR
ncbi:mechanosensitive ion channel family protein [Olivibacter sp. SDN3]|uniref:mechanosensitive ion channel family protein n=1 Tax=Olivibacter sp. SDN3 TaxID=2764720 RepID=UPI0016514595|nr:mechanosensitive ion channel family protein [Olivibacter sp. SDN3]QNL51682.1 mechanosensitive ion channel family protein [Olivibacter sp. SDN3]